MSIEGLRQAMASVTTQTGKKFDITVFDACLMSMIEVGDQLKNVTDYTVSSEAAIDAGGFPYDLLIKRLVDNPNQTPAEYSRGMVDDFYSAYQKSKATASAIDESKIGPIVTAVDNLSLTLIANMKAYSSSIGSARSVAQHMVYGSNGVFWFIDLRVFVDQLANSIPNGTIAAQTAAVKTAMGNAVYERHTKQLEGKQYGLSINFPPNKVKYDDKSYLAQNYQGVDLLFPNETNWDEMLLLYYTKK